MWRACLCVCAHAWGVVKKEEKTHSKTSMKQVYKRKLERKVQSVRERKIVIEKKKDAG